MEMPNEIKMLISYLRTKGKPQGCAECQSGEWAAAHIMEHLWHENQELKLKLEKLLLEADPSELEADPSEEEGK